MPNYLAEVFGTFFLIFAGTGVVVVDQITGGRVGGLAISLVWGLVVLAMIYSIGHVSGAHMNPAVTIGFYSVGRHPREEVLPYIASQLIGAVAASVMLRLIFLGYETNLALTAPAGTELQSFLLEIVITFMLMFIIMGVATDDRAQGAMAGIAIGGTIAALVIFAGPISGCSMNPARSFAPALVTFNFAHYWLYVAGPIIGAVLGAQTYRLLRAKPAHDL
jgi:MIP family channel proteins